MSLTIWKFEIQVTDRQTVSMPAGSRVLCVQTQNGLPHVWALADRDRPYEERAFLLVGTGHPIDADPGRYVGTFQMRNGALVFHLFEATP